MKTELETGRDAFGKGQFDVARAHLERITAGAPGYAAARELLARLAVQSGDPAKAVLTARQAVEADSDYVQGWLTLSRSLEALEDYRDAREASAEVLRRKPDNYDAWLLHGNHAMKLGEFEKAVADYQRAQALAPQRIEALANQAAALDKLGRVDAALGCLAQARDLAPESAGLLLNIGRLHSTRGDYPAAIEAYRGAVTLDENFSDGWINLTIAYLRLNEPEQALAAAQRCLAANPADRSATALAMMAYQQRGDRNAYRRLYAFEELIYEAAIEVPEGYVNLAQFNTALVDAAVNHATLIHEPLGKATRHGYQSGNLLHGDDSGVFASLHDQVRRHIERFLARQSEIPGHPYARFEPGECDFYMWATVLDEQGHQSPHIHPAGWVSGVYYAQIPEAITSADEAQAGWIEFGKPDLDLPGVDASNTDLRCLQPREGHLFLFPSYFYHRTIPYRGKSRRVSIAFDLVPRTLRKKHGDSLKTSWVELEQQVTRLLREGRLDEATAASQQMLKRKPEDPVALTMMARCLQQRGQPVQAVTYFERALEQDTDYLGARLGLIGLLRAGRHARALQLADDGLERNAAPALQLARAELLIDLGRFVAARADLQTVLAKAPGQGRANWLAALVGEVRVDRARLVSVAEKARPGQRPGVHFALGRLFEQAGDTARSVRHYAAANEGLHKQFASHIQAVDTPVLVEAFSPQFFADSEPGSDSNLPVFIVGMPRTGTTLVEQLLASHPQVATAGDTDALWRLVASLASQLPAGKRLPEDIAALPPHAWHTAGLQYLDHLKSVGGNALRVIDRHLPNYTMLGLIQRLFPDARVIHCRRDADDTRWSCYAHWFDNMTPYGYDLQSIAAAQQQESTLTAHWQKNLSLRILTVDYEHLASDFETQAKRIVAFCALDWDAVVTRYPQRDAPVISGDRIGIRKEVYTSSIGRAASFLEYFDNNGGGS